MTTLRIRGGRVIDPIHGVDGELRDIGIRDGHIVALDPREAVTQEIDAGGCIVMVIGSGASMAVILTVWGWPRKTQKGTKKGCPIIRFLFRGFLCFSWPSFLPFSVFRPCLIRGLDSSPK